MQSLNERPEIGYYDLTDDELVLSYNLLNYREIPIPLDLSVEIDKRGIFIEELNTKLAK